MAASNQYMEAAANTIFELSSDEFVREQCRARDEYNAYVKRQQQIIAEKDKALNEKDKQLTERDAEIERLKAELAKTKNK